MSDKPRLKDSDEILNSIGRRAGETSRALPDVPDAPPPVKRTRRAAKAGPVAGEPDTDNSPLDFGKYEIPARKTKKSAPAKAAEPSDESARQTSEQSGKPESKAKESEKKSTPRARKPASGNADAVPAAKRTGSKQALPSTDAEKKPKKKSGEKQASPHEAEPYEFPKMTKEELERSQNPLPEKYSFESFDVPDKQEERRRRMLTDEEERNSFRQSLSDTFEKQFSQIFDGNPVHQEEAPVPTPTAPVRQESPSTPPDIPDFWQITDNEDPQSGDLDYDSGLNREADDFIGRFANDIKNEEDGHSEDFRDTLAQKFMRERERYLRELGIAAAMDGEGHAAGEPDVPLTEEPEKPRRRLDFQIQPEMHTHGDADRPVTYTRSGTMRQAAHDDGAFAPAAGADQLFPPPVPSGGKKTSEQLLLELVAQTKAAEERLNKRHQPAAPAINAAVFGQQLQGAAPAHSHNVTEPIREKRTLRPKIIIPSVLASLVVLAGIAWFSLNTLIPAYIASGDVIPDNSTSSASTGTVTIYESRDNISQRAFVSDALIKRSDISVKNMSVENLLIISDIDSPGAVTLQNINVDGAIHVKNCAVNELDLIDVQTPRVIINNADSPVLIRVGGNSNIGTIEVKSAGASVVQEQLVSDALGIRNILIRPDEVDGSLDVSLTGLTLPALASTGESVIKFNESFVESMASDGSLFLEGTGRVVNLAIGADSAASVLAGPLDLAAAVKPMSLSTTAKKPLRVILKGVSVSNLNMKSPGDVDISSNIDTMSIFDNMSISGNGSIGSLTVSERFGNSRLLVDISNLKVMTMTCDTETRIMVSGAAKINDLTCNASTYALGNKVGYLRVNADRVIYESEPDKTMVASGIRPPESMAENPNLDYSLATSQNNQSTDTSGDAVSTTCGHTRENGGFLTGDGSKENPYEVSTPEQLAHVGQHLTAYFVQTGDINISDSSAYVSGFDMIAAYGTPFSGQYDGGGFSIRNLKISSDKERVGLFGENIGVIKNIHILSGEITSTLAQGAVVGGIVGFNYDTGSVLSCSNRARITAKSAYAGGIAGYNYEGRIRDCYNAAKISSTDNAGGIVGVSRNDGLIAGCYNVGTIEGDISAGGIAGTNEARITNCYYLEDTAEDGVGSGEGSASMKTSEEMQSQQMVDDLAAGNDESLWTRGSTGEGAYNYPVLKSPPSNNVVIE